MSTGGYFRGRFTTSLITLTICGAGLAVSATRLAGDAAVLAIEPSGEDQEIAELKKEVAKLEANAISAEPQFTEADFSRTSSLRRGSAPVEASRNGRDDKVPHQPFFDIYFFVYWGAVVAAALLLAGVIALWRKSLGNSDSDDGDGEDGDEMELSENMWALNLVAALGQVKLSGQTVPAEIIALVSAGMGGLQLAAVTLMVGAIDPHAEPVTKVPASPWLQHSDPWPVNTMKWFMVTFLVVGQIGEVAQCRVLVDQTLRVNAKRLTVPRVVPLGAAFLQYCVSISVIWAGVSVILSFQTVPDIVYSSMSVFFITSADEMFYECIQSVFDLDCDFDVQGKGDAEGAGPESVEDAAESPSQPQRSIGRPAAPHLGMGGGGGMFGHHVSIRHRTVQEPSFKDASPRAEPKAPVWLYWVLKFLQVLPALLGFFLLSRAMYTGVMPTSRFGFGTMVMR